MTALPPLSLNAWLRWDVVARMLPPTARSVLEVGCGQGGFAVRLAQRYRYVGLEPDDQSCAVARARLAVLGVGEVRNGDLSTLGADERFDLVCAFEVLEHLPDDAGALRDWVDRLVPGGWLLLSTPAWQARFAAADEMAGHFRRYDPAVLDRRLADAGLHDRAVRHVGMPLGYLLEAGRNRVGRRRLAAVGAASMADRTAGSGRLFQPKGAATGLATRVGTAPFRLLQRGFPSTGPGLVARGRRPLSSGEPSA